MRGDEVTSAAATASRLLGRRVRLRLAHRPLPASSLTAADRWAWEALPAGARRGDWLLGRAALQGLLPAGADVSSVSFPHRRLSLTHGGGVAVAAACDEPGDGLGVDYEPWRTPDPRVARFFLRPRERAWVRSLPPPAAARALLLLWTVKEALYKATPDNAAAVLLDYELARPGDRSGPATHAGGRRFRFASVALAGGALAVAVGVDGGRLGAAV